MTGDGRLAFSPMPARPSLPEHSQSWISMATYILDISAAGLAGEIGFGLATQVRVFHARSEASNEEN